MRRGGLRQSESKVELPRIIQKLDKVDGNADGESERYVLLLVISPSFHAFRSL